jgi:hypothetical protein
VSKEKDKLELNKLRLEIECSLGRLTKYATMAMTDEIPEDELDIFEKDAATLDIKIRMYKCLSKKFIMQYKENFLIDPINN